MEELQDGVYDTNFTSSGYNLYLSIDKEFIILKTVSMYQPIVDDIVQDSVIYNFLSFLSDLFPPDDGFYIINGENDILYYDDEHVKEITTKIRKDYRDNIEHKEREFKYIYKDYYHISHRLDYLPPK